jgi:hypothetical protein
LTGISHKQREYQFPLFDSASIGISITKRNRGQETGAWRGTI